MAIVHHLLFCTYIAKFLIVMEVEDTTGVRGIFIEERTLSESCQLNID